MRAFFAGLLTLLTSLHARSQSGVALWPPPLRTVTAEEQPDPPGSPTDEALAFYSKLTGRSILRAPHLPSNLPASLKPQLPQETNTAIAFLESELSKQGIELVPHGELFALAVPPGWSSSPIAAKVSQIQRRSMQDARPTLAAKPPLDESHPPLNPEELLPEGAVDLRNADFEQFLRLFSELLNRTLLRPGSLPRPQIKFVTQRPMAKSDVLYAFETILVLNNITAMDDGEKFVQVVTIQEVPKLWFRAPKVEPPEPLIDSGHIREFGGVSWAPGQQKPQARVRANDLVAYYAELTDRVFVPDDRLGQQRVIFKAQTSLTKPELLYALETTLALNGLAVGSDDAKTIRIIRASDVRESGKAPK
jgi:hypothetical protein